MNELDQKKLKEASCDAAASASNVASSSSTSSSSWSVEEVQLLVKAVTMFPAGTVKRWEVIATFVNTHSLGGSGEKNARMVISKVKSLQKLESDDKASLNKQAYTFFEQQHRPKDKSSDQVVDKGLSTPSERYGAYNCCTRLFSPTPPSLPPSLSPFSVVTASLRIIPK